MLIKRLYIENFKSISKVDLHLEQFTLIVGANAAGKSNIINVLRFISDAMNRGVDNAISLQGGIEYMANCSVDRGTPIKIEFEVCMEDEDWIRMIRKESLGLQINSFFYAFEITPNKRGSGYKITSDTMCISYNCLDYSNKGKTEEKWNDLSTIYRINFSRKNKERKITLVPEVEGDSEKINKIKNELLDNLGAEIFSEIMRDELGELMLYRAAIIMPPMFSENAFIRLFDFDPKQLKKSCSMASIKTLEEDGANIAAVLQDILKDKKNRNELLKLLNNALPFIESLSVENNLDQSFSFKIKEKYSQKAFFSNFLSDGTVSIVALIIALYFERHSNIIILEEPERNVHPMLLQKIIEMVKEVSRKKQIILTTHNPEILKNVTTTNLRFVKRDKEGFSVVTNPVDSEMVNAFLENELGLDDLFMQNLLG